MKVKKQRSNNNKNVLMNLIEISMWQIFHLCLLSFYCHPGYGVSIFFYYYYYDIHSLYGVLSELFASHFVCIVYLFSYAEMYNNNGVYEFMMMTADNGANVRWWNATYMSTKSEQCVIIIVTYLKSTSQMFIMFFLFFWKQKSITIKR